MSDNWWWYPAGLAIGVMLVVLGTRERATTMVVFGAVVVAVAGAGLIEVNRT